MRADSLPFDSLIDSERAAVERSGRLGTGHWLIVGTSFVITLLAWYGSLYVVTERAEQRFQREADQVVELVIERLQRYEDALWGAAAAIEANESVDTVQGWRDYTQRLNLASRYPNVTALNIVHNIDSAELSNFVAAQRMQRPDFNIRSQNEGDMHLVITHVSPERGNEAAVGYDIAHDPGRRSAFMEAAQLNEARLTQPLVLVQDTEKDTSFVLAVPFYRDWQNPGLGNRAQLLEGFVAMPLMMSRVVNGLIGIEGQSLSSRITDGDVVIQDNHHSQSNTVMDGLGGIDSDDKLQSASPTDATLEQRGLFRSEQVLDVYGRQWKFDISSNSRFNRDAGYLFPSVVLIGGLFVDLLLLGMFVLLVRANRRALNLARRTATKLGEKADALVATNRELESFAYVVSHDLKTPLRGIQDLTDYIEEDLQDAFEIDDAHREARRNLGRIGQQVKRSNALIEGILDYSGVGMRKEQIIEVNVVHMVDMIVDAMPIRPEQLVMRGEFPVFETYGVRLAQVLGNLICNAFKYHHDSEKATVVVEVKELVGWYRFSVSDDGPGIDPRFHDRIFEVFKTLQSKDAIESTGVGLSIVKKSVELIGGRVWIKSEPGEGTTMLFDWPKNLEEDAEKARRAA